MPNFPARDLLPPELRNKQRKCVRRHNLWIFAALSAFFIDAFVALGLIRRNPSLAIALLIALLIFQIYLAFAKFRGDSQRYCHEIGFLCPYCGQPLYYASSLGDYSPLITRGECPRCQKSLLSSRD
jgi:hypothetical protein